MRAVCFRYAFGTKSFTSIQTLAAGSVLICILRCLPGFLHRHRGFAAALSASFFCPQRGSRQILVPFEAVPDHFAILPSGRSGRTAANLHLSAKSEIPNKQAPSLPIPEHPAHNNIFLQCDRTCRYPAQKSTCHIIGNHHHSLQCLYAGLVAHTIPAR